jgi:hypothetical protein
MHPFDTGPIAAYLVAADAYNAAPADERDDMFVAGLRAVLREEARSPPCGFALPDGLCRRAGKIRRRHHYRALCDRHALLLDERRDDLIAAEGR